MVDCILNGVEEASKSLAARFSAREREKEKERASQRLRSLGERSFQRKKYCQWMMIRKKMEFA